jgi:Icc protein
MVQLVQITDTHLFATPGRRLKGVDVDAGLAAVVAAIGRDHPAAEAVLLTGDLVHEETTGAYARLEAALAPLGLPVYCLPGNHEDKALLAERCGASPFLHYERQAVVGDWRVILLDSARPPEPAGWLPPAELAFLDAALAADPDRPALVGLHHPPIPVGSAWLDPMAVGNGEQLVRVIGPHPQVRAVVFGHIHQAFDAQVQGVRYLGAPSTCAQFLPGAAESAVDPRPPGYRWLRLNRDGSLATGVTRVPLEGA